MCDYSLHAVKSRPARVGDRLVSSTFRCSATRGLTAFGEPDVAVCLIPGTEVAFDAPAAFGGFLHLFERTSAGCVARFRQVDPDNPYSHHDTFEFEDGCQVLVHRLKVGQHLTVLQLPAQRETTPAPKLHADAQTI